MTDGPGGHEQRAHPRTNLVLKVEYPTREGFLHDYTVNISQGGTMICTRHPLREGDAVELILSFPGLLAPISLVGHVRWIQPREEAPFSNAGIAFDMEDRRTFGFLSRVVERIVMGDQAVVLPAVRVLVVDDNRHIAQLITSGLASHHQRSNADVAFAVEQASDGRQALELLRAEPFDLLIADIFLPLISGEKLIRTLRSDERWANLAIIAVSCGGDEVCEKALAAGADFFLAKPFRLVDVIATARRLIGLGEQL